LFSAIAAIAVGAMAAVVGWLVYRTRQLQFRNSNTEGRVFDANDLRYHYPNSPGTSRRSPCSPAIHHSRRARVAFCPRFRKSGHHVTVRNL
jgi:hypothetical protein